MTRSYPHPTARRGAVVLLVALMLPVLLLVTAFAINVAQMHLTRAELRAAADAAAHAGARELSRSQSIAHAEAAAISAASRNLVAGQPLTLQSGDIQFGVNTPATTAQIAAGSGPWRFAPYQQGGPINTVRVVASKATGSASGHVQLLFTPLLDTKVFQPVITAGAMQIDRDIVLVVDRSGSMSLDAVDRWDNPAWVDWHLAYQTFAAAVGAATASERQQYIAAIDPLLNAYNTGQITQNEYETQKAPIAAAYNDARNAARQSFEHLDPGPHPHIPLKWDALSDAVDVFLDTLEGTVPEEKVGLVWYDNEVGTAQPLTFDYDAIRAAMDELGPRMSTGIGIGLQRGAVVVKHPQTARPFAQKVVIVMTDGHHNSGVSPDVIARQVARNDYLIIHTITFGSNANQTLMQMVAEIGGGHFWHANDPDALDEAYSSVAVDIPTALTD